MKDWIHDAPATALLFAVFVLVALVGGALVLFDASADLSYEDYLNQLTRFAGAVGLLGIGRGLLKGLSDDVSDVAIAHQETDPETVQQDEGDKGAP